MGNEDISLGTIAFFGILVLGGYIVGNIMPIQIIVPQSDEIGWNIKLDGYLFDPTPYVARLEDTVTIRNNMNLVCELESREDKWESQIINMGEQVTLRFSEPGTYNYLCKGFLFEGQIIVV